jgi:steroid 5-alpha reductase family enzyme
MKPYEAEGLMTALDPLTALVVVYAVMAGVMLVLWLVDRWTRNASIADVGWCVGLVSAVAWYAWSTRGDLDRKILVLLMAALYGLRLGLYILLNRVIGKEEDARYQHLRRQWGSSEPIAMFGYYQLQAAAVALFSLPFLMIMQKVSPPFSLWELAGFLVWLAAVVGEGFADWQLAQFRSKSSNRDRVCRDGLWRYSRHPNYFFEWLHWWAYVVMGVSTPGWLLTWIGPVGMGWTLLKVTGIPWAERQALASRGEDYREYQRATSSFIPWFPKTR